MLESQRWIKLLHAEGWTFVPITSQTSDIPGPAQPEARVAHRLPVELGDVRRALRIGRVGDDPPTAELDHAVGDAGDLTVVGDDQDRGLLAVGLLVEKLEDLGNGKIHVFESVVRSSQKIAVECREAGLLVHEYEQQAAEANATAPKWFQLSAAERKQRKSYSTAAGGLARDYEALVQEILQRFSEVRSA